MTAYKALTLAAIYFIREYYPHRDALLKGLNLWLAYLALRRVFNDIKK